MMLTDQSISTKISIALTMIMFVVGLISSILSFLTFYRGDPRKVGCGMYLLASSITSFLTVSMLTAKFWFVVLTHLNVSVSRPILQGGCKSLELILKVFLYMGNWLNACVAIERALTVYRGVHFNKMLSKRVAWWVIFLLPFFITTSIIYEPIYRILYDDEEEQRFWCVFQYSLGIYVYSTIIIFVHFTVPLAANLFSVLFIILRSARQRAVARTQQNYNEHLREQFKKHKHLIISPMILVILSLPRLIVSLLSGCMKISRNPLLYICGYFLSFIPSVVVFFVFVLPSKLYKKQFIETIRHLRQSIYRS